MPGLFGGVGAQPTAAERLEREFGAIWPDAAVRRAPGAALGGQAWGPGIADVDGAAGSWVGVDGEPALCGAVTSPSPGAPPPFLLGADGLELLCPAVGNVAVVERDTVSLAADWTGAIPLYYTELAGGLLFSSHLRPLARAVSAKLDSAGVVEFLRDGFTIGARTPFQGISRLLGGQSLSHHRARGLRITEHSRAWAEQEPRFADPEVAAEAATEALREVFAALPAGAGPAALMMSAGWDSRTLLAAAQAFGSPEQLRCYSHGDLGSRELRLARAICESQQVPWQAQPLDDDLYDSELLRRSFERTENVVFPHWHRAGRLLEAQQVRFVCAGVFGEMLGGRYWMGHTQHGVRKAVTQFSALLLRDRMPEPPLREARARARATFRFPELPRPWYLSGDALPDAGRVRDEINADVDGALGRYGRRGAATLNQMAEAFQGEHIGSRYCIAQLLSCRADLDVAIPLANRRVLEVATCTPIHARMQNELNRRIIRRLRPELLRFPMGATLLPAGAPILLQETSRVVRKLAQTGKWGLHFASRGLVKPPRLAWANYEFLRTGRALRRIVGSLSADLWDVDALRGRITAIERGEYRAEMLPLADLMAKILTLDLLLR